MCDQSTRIWCCRIGLVFSVLGVLCTMIFQLWSYYFSLVSEMDDQTFERPQVRSFMHICDDLVFSWNTECNSLGSKQWRCSLKNPEGVVFYADQSGVANVTQEANGIVIHSILDCVRITMWSIPW